MLMGLTGPEARLEWERVIMTIAGATGRNQKGIKYRFFFFFFNLMAK